ncbi:MAG: methionine synthase [Clostridiaceae bacterium]|nr:methionine synthase [Clostridiaceae bacterium]
MDKSEVLRYLGHKGQQLSRGLDLEIDEMINKCRDISKPKYVYKIYNIKKHPDGVEFLGSSLYLFGKSVINHLKGADKCAIFAATLGADIDREIAVMQKTDITRALILDAAASALIEEVCDTAQNEIAGLAKREGRKITSRYSPGYGDLSLDYQQKILNMLDAQRKIGLTASTNNILLPRKSVTALIGFI